MNNYSFVKGWASYRRSSLVFLLVVCWTPILSAQKVSVKGIVNDASGAMPGVTITIKNHPQTGTISDSKGHYQLLASPMDTLVVSFVGCKTAYIPIQGRSVIMIHLVFDTTNLQEVRVNAGYYSVKEKERTGSIARISAADIENQPVTNVLATMQGRMPGVNIVQSTGTPGGGFAIQIRGQNSLRPNANNPLYIIDGVPYAYDPIGSPQTSSAYPSTTSPLNSINPSTIESIEVLKDADATAIYGSRGANGVVLITTKKGKAGKTRFTVNASTGAAKLTRFLSLLHTQDYLAMRRQAFVNDGISYSAWDYDVNGTWDPNRYTDWQKELLGGTATQNSLQASLSGGSAQTQFLLSGSYHNEGSVLPGSFQYVKGGSQLNISHSSEDRKFQLTFSASYTSQNNDQPAFDFSYDARSLPPNAPALYDAQGNLNWENGTWDNPLRYLNAEFKAKTDDWIANSLLSYEILDGLLLKTSLGFSQLSTTETRTNPSSIYNPAYNFTSANSTLYSNNTRRSSWIIEPQLNWSKSFGKGKLDCLVGTTFQSQQSSLLYQSATGFPSNALIYNLAAAKTISVSRNDQTQYRYQALFGRLNYQYLERYIVNLTARRDGSSRFGPGNQFATFAAVGAAWLFSKERLFDDVSWLSFGKLRGSYGSSGSDQIGDYQFFDSYTTTGINYNGSIGLEPSQLYNANFGWETNKKLELALELGFFQDRIVPSIAWYRNRSSNQLVGIPLPGTTGFAVLQDNLDATVENQGLELSLNTINFKNPHFSWTTALNLSFSKNKLMRFPGLSSSTYSQKYRVGQPLNIALRYAYLDVDPQTGVFRFEDVNGDGTISAPEDKQTVVDLNPAYYGGLSNALRYKKWQLSFLLQFVKQRNYRYPMGAAGLMSNQSTSVRDSWQQIGDVASYQRYTTGSNYPLLLSDYNYSESTGAITDASYLRLKNIALSYELPLPHTSTQCRLSVQAQNLLTFTKYPDGDPEFSSYGFLPPLRVISAGVQLTF
ncbi:SusC/RagA family TonB-linked outer membrane protein [Flavobacterium sp. ST-87]|uniref:SusC/RagA family TonB-linked outer membrane protein n=1 Tax=Flavobacterium plantiphilum TaxID=3163297 RepID=A0ABW8XPZ5_9FLAO